MLKAKRRGIQPIGKTKKKEETKIIQKSAKIETRIEQHCSRATKKSFALHFQQHHRYHKENNKLVQMFEIHTQKCMIYTLKGRATQKVRIKSAKKYYT